MQTLGNHRFLVLGSGGREHALCWRLSQPDHSEGQRRQHAVYAAPGNPGIAKIVTCAPIPLNDFQAIAQFCLDQGIDVVVVGPEQPLVEGIANYFAARPDLAAIKVLGPNKACAQLEGSKAFSKAFMARHNIPTAAYQEFTQADLAACLAYIQTQQLPIVIKADGLAAGKGVIIAQSYPEAAEAVTEMLSGEAFGAAGERVVIEQFLDGKELSYFVLADGKGHYLTLPQAKDYKRIGVGDTGLNTGGMGTISPVPFADEAMLAAVDATIVRPTLAGLEAEGLHYVGFLFIGLMVVDGKPFVIEYNCRLGDPETQSLMMRLGPDLADAFVAAANGELSTWEGRSLSTTDHPVCTVVLASGGYPGTFEKGLQISGHETSLGLPDIEVFHAGTALDADGKLVTAGGRVLAVSATASTWPDTIALAQSAAATINWEGRYYRTDIGVV